VLPVNGSSSALMRERQLILRSGLDTEAARGRARYLSAAKPRNSSFIALI
jgi:hypothetical protein